MVTSSARAAPAEAQLLGAKVQGNYFANSDPGTNLFTPGSETFHIFNDGTITAMGLLISAFVQTQVAAQFLTAILCVIITTNFAGVLSPVSTLDGVNFYIAQGFPSSWFQKVSLGVFTKNWQVQWHTLGVACVVMMGFSVAYLTAARLFVSKQER